MYSNEELTAIYKKANGVPEGKAPPITTAFIFAAMRLAADMAVEAYKVSQIDPAAEAEKARQAAWKPEPHGFQGQDPKLVAEGYYGHPKCDRYTNAPCEWSNTPVIEDDCSFCGKRFPTW